MMDDTAPKEHAQIINQSQVAGGSKAMAGLPTALLKNAIKCFLLCLLRQRRVIMKKPGTDRVSVPGYVKPSFIRMSSNNLILKSL